MPEQKITPNFRKAIGKHGVHSRDPEANLKFVPDLRIALYDADHPGLTVEVPGHGPKYRRRPDGWFHPSTHPMWPEAALYHYLAAPDRLQQEVWEQEGVMAVGAGHFFHDLIQHIGLHHGLLVEQPPCQCGGDHNRAEAMLVDENVGSRGHCDGFLPGGELFEMKTAHPAIVSGLKKADWETRHEYWREKKPPYYAQAQEYMRMTGIDLVVTVVIATSYPYDLTEVHIPYDRVAAERVRGKYERVRQLVADGYEPTATSCCAQFSSCPSGPVCEQRFT